MFWVGQNGDISSQSSSSNPNSPRVRVQPKFAERYTKLAKHDIPATASASIQNVMTGYGTEYSIANTSRYMSPLDFETEFSEHIPEQTENNDEQTKSGKGSTTKAHLRRRAQNRASQRAFRERKERHVRALEHQLENLHEQHQDLAQSYAKQTDEVSRLTARIEQLTSQLRGLRASQDLSSCVTTSPADFESFDAYLPTDNIYGKYQSTSFHQGVNLQPEFALDGFEDSL